MSDTPVKRFTFHFISVRSLLGLHEQGIRSRHLRSNTIYLSTYISETFDLHQRAWQPSLKIRFTITLLLYYSLCPWQYCIQ